MYDPDDAALLKSIVKPDWLVVTPIHSGDGNINQEDMLAGIKVLAEGLNRTKLSGLQEILKL